jgi:hypothetical protein
MLFKWVLYCMIYVLMTRKRSVHVQYKHNHPRSKHIVPNLQLIKSVDVEHRDTKGQCTYILQK